MQIYVFGRQLTEQEFQKFLAEYYPYAYTLAEQFKSPYLSDDMKENIAIKALERAARTYDPDKGTKFSSYLYLLIMNDLKSEAVKMKKRPLSVRDVSDPESGEKRDIFEFIEDYKSLEEYDHQAYLDLEKALSTKLSDRQKQLLAILKNPEVYADQYNKKFSPKEPVSKLNYEAIGKMLGVSIATVTYELKKIQAITRDILTNQERAAKKK